MIKAIFFDFDGTLAKSFEMAIEAQKNVARQYNYTQIHFSKDLHEMSFGQIFRKKAQLRYTQIPLFYIRLKKEFTKIFPQTKLYKGISLLIQDLSKHKILMGVLSTNISEDPVQAIKNILHKENLVHYFNFIEHASFITGKKNKLAQLLKQYNLKAHEVLYVGDEVKDIKASKQVGMLCVGVTWGKDSAKRLIKEEPLALIDSPAELKDILDKLITLP